MTGLPTLPGETTPEPTADGMPEGRMATNLMHFGRLLRGAGLKVGPGAILDAVRAVEKVGIGSRQDLYWTLHATLVRRREEKEIFDQAFHMFWQNPKLLERMMGLLLPEMRVPAEDKKEMSRRLAESFNPGAGEGGADREEKEEIEIDAAFTFSERELLQEMDFEKMSGEETANAIAAIKRMRLSITEVPTRRFKPHPHGRRVDLRSTLRAAMRTGGHDIPLQHRKRRRRHPPLVILCDISGSMSRYSRMLIHFMHAVTNDRDRVSTFLFGTRLTNITRFLRHRDIDIALEKVSDVVEDWSGGTRIGASIEAFNRDWSRRVLGQGAMVLLISDGLDREVGAGLEEEMERLRKSCRRLIWLNPLLRFEGFAPKSRGVRAMLPHVDEFRPVHNLASLTELADVLSRPIPASRGRIMLEEG